MGRAGYSEDCDNDWALICWRGAVASAIRGKRGQAFLREMLTALDALPEKRLIAEELQAGEQVCAIGSVGVMRGVDMSKLDPECPEHIAHAFGISPALVREIEFVNDEDFWDPHNVTPEKRYEHVRKWVESQIAKESAP